MDINAGNKRVQFRLTTMRQEGKHPFLGELKERAPHCSTVYMVEGFEKETERRQNFGLQKFVEIE